MCELVVTG